MVQMLTNYLVYGSQVSRDVTSIAGRYNRNKFREKEVLSINAYGTSEEGVPSALLVGVGGPFQRGEGHTSVVPEEAAVRVEGGLLGEVEDRTYSVVAGDEWVVPAGWVAVRMVREEEGFHGCKDRGEVDQEVEGWAQDVGAEPPGVKQTGLKFDGQWDPVVEMSSVEVVGHHETQEEDRRDRDRVQIATAIASDFVAVEGDEN